VKATFLVVPPAARHNIEMRPLVPAALVSLAALVSTSCGPSQGAPASGRGPGGAALRVRAEPVTQQDVVYSIRAVGSLQADEVVQVTAEVEGPVRDVVFNEGDRVSRETLLAKIDPERYRLEAERAEAAHRQAEAERARAESDFARREALAREELVSVEELNRARQDAERAMGVAEAARAARDMARENRRRSDVRPSRPGLVNTKTIDTGQFVKSGDVLATIVDVSRLRLRFTISEGESMRARVGQDVSFKVGSLGEETFKARIYHVGAVADPATRQVEVLAWARNPGPLKPGFFADVDLASQTHKGALVVPRTAVRSTESGFIAYVVQDGKAQRRTVERGLETADGRVQIVSGLAAGEMVVTEGSDRLADGVAVQVTS
jgi:multidrug efflux system membrane fusion protein